MLKDTIKFQIVTIFCQIVNFGGSWMIAHFLTVPDRGVLGKNLLYITLALAIANAGYNEYISRAVRENVKVNLLRIILIGSSAAFVLITALFFCNIILLTIPNLLFSFFILVFYYYSTLSLTFIWGRGYEKMMYFMRFFNAGFIPLMVILCKVLHTINGQIVYMSTFLVYFFSSIIIYIWQRRYQLNLFEFRGKNSMGMLVYNSLSTILLMVIFNIDKLIISSVVSISIFAQYLISTSIFSPVVELMASISSVIIIKIDKSQNVFKKILLLLLAYLVILLFIGKFLAFLLPIVFGAKYSQATQIAQHFPLMFFFVVCFRIFDSLLRVYHLKASSVINFIGLLLFGVFAFLGRFYLKNISISELAVMLTSIFGIITFMQLIVYARYGRMKID